MPSTNKKKEIKIFSSPYEKMKKKEEFFFVQTDKEHQTDQSQLASASIVEMARKYGIEAIIAKAEQLEINDKLKDKLYGYDLTNGFKSTEEILKTKNRLKNVFENIPARIRKELFNDNITEFLNTYQSGDEKKLEALKRVGLVSDSQYNKVVEFNKKLKAEKEEQEMILKFKNKLETIKGGMYEEFKKTGNIMFDNNNNNAQNNTNLQNNIQKSD